MSAVLIPHPSLTAAQCELLCRREGLALAHLGRARLVLLQTSAPREAQLRIAAPDPSTLHKRRVIRALHEELARVVQPGPDAA